MRNLILNYLVPDVLIVALLVTAGLPGFWVVVREKLRGQLS